VVRHRKKRVGKGEYEKCAEASFESCDKEDMKISVERGVRRLVVIESFERDREREYEEVFPGFCIRV
jgi:hypothetical protein